MNVTPFFVLRGSCLVMKNIGAVKRHFRTRDECVGNYGGPAGEAIQSSSRANCASRCTLDGASCKSFVYRNTTKDCWLFTYLKGGSSTPGCSPDVVYGDNVTPNCVYNPPNEYRLCDGSTNRGRVEVIQNGASGTVCDEISGDDYPWTWRNAKVVCKLFGFSGNPVLNAGFGRGKGPIILDDVDCTGSGKSLFACRRNPLYSHDCTHDEDVGVICF